MSLPPLFPPPSNQAPVSAKPLPEIDFSNISFDYEDDSGDSPKPRKASPPSPSDGTALGNFLHQAKQPPQKRAKCPKSAEPKPKPKKRKKLPPKMEPGSVVIKKRIDTATPAKHLTALFETFSHHEHMEVEAKLGTWNGRQFVSGIEYDDFMKIHDRLCSYKGWSNNDTFMVWIPTFDYMLDNNIRVTKSSAGNSFMKKTTIQHVTFKCAERKYDLRVSMKEELPVKVTLPQEPNMVRVKKRKSFIHKERWRFDLTIVWTGRDEQDAQSKTPCYEVECEFVGPPASAGPNHEYTGRSLLEKMVDFLGRDTPLTLKKV